jgi:hypothetical protein
MVRGPLFARALRFRPWERIGLDERRRIGPTLLQFGNPRHRRRQVRLELRNQSAQFGVFGHQTGVVVNYRYAASIP